MNNLKIIFSTVFTHHYKIVCNFYLRVINTVVSMCTFKNMSLRKQDRQFKKFLKNVGIVISGLNS